MTPRWYSDTTQIAWICEMLFQGHEISHACEYEAVKGWRLSAVIHILRDNKYGYNWPIIYRDGKNNVRFYRLDPDTDVTKLKLPPSYIVYLQKRLELEGKGMIGHPLFHVIS